VGVGSSSSSSSSIGVSTMVAPLLAAARDGCCWCQSWRHVTRSVERGWLGWLTTFLTTQPPCALTLALWLLGRGLAPLLQPRSRPGRRPIGSL
jgi:hypothetical protein